MFSIKYDMSITLRNPLVAKIMDRKEFLAQLLDEYPMLIERWHAEQDERFKAEAKEVADGDEDIEKTVLSQLETAFDDIEGKKDMFYQSMFLMAYSYYESILTVMNKDARPNNVESIMCAPNGIVLSQESINNINYISNVISLIRNNVCHNNAGTTRNAKKVNGIIAKCSDVVFENDIITFTGDSFIRDVLEKEYSILTELANKMGYKSVIYRP